MKISRLLPLLFAGGALTIGEAKASINFDLSGTFDYQAPTTSVSAPNTTFDLKFSLPANFATSPSYAFDPGHWFSLEPQISYTLGNNPAIAIKSNTAGSPDLLLKIPALLGEATLQSFCHLIRPTYCSLYLGIIRHFILDQNLIPQSKPALSLVYSQVLSGLHFRIIC